MVKGNLIYTRTWFVLQECGDFTWRVSDCEELVGLLTGDDENDIKIKNFLKVLIVPVFLLNRNKPLLLQFCANLHV